MAEIVNEGQIALNDIVFNIEGRVQRFLASRFAPKTVIGGYDDESDQVVSSFTWKRFDGGFGTQDLISPSDAPKAFATDAYTRFPNVLTINPSPEPITDSSTSGEGQWKLAVHEGYLWGADSGVVRRYDHVNDSMEVSVTDPATSSALTDFQSGFLNDSAILIAVNDSGSITYSNNPTDTTSWATDSGHPVNKITFWRDLLWGISDSGSLAFTPDITSGWTTVSRLRTDTGMLVDMFVAPVFKDNQLEDAIYVSTLEGLRQYDNENERFVAPEQTMLLPRTTQAATTVWNGQIYYSQKARVFRFTPGPVNAIEDVSPRFLGDLTTTPIDNLNSISDLTSGPTGVYAGTVNADSLVGTNIEFDGNSWSTLSQGAIHFGTSERRHSVLYSGHTGKPKLYYTTSILGFSNLNRLMKVDVPLTALDIVSDTTLLFQSANHELPFFDGFIGGTKLATSVSLRYFIDDTREDIDIDYRVDETDEYIEIGSTKDEGLSGDGTVTFDITDTNGNTGVPFERIQFRINPISDTLTGHTNHAPFVRRFTFNYVKSQSLRWGYRVAIKTGSGQSPTETFRDLEALFTTNKLYDFTFRNDATGQPDVEKVKVLDLQSAEETGYGGHADYILTLVQAVA